jgi:hypothetical protein
MLEDDPFDCSLVLPGQAIAIGLLYIKAFSVQPIFTFFLRLLTMDMNRLASLVGIEKKPPATDEENCRHGR